MNNNKVSNNISTHQDKNIDKSHCQTLYWNLLQSAKINQTLPSHFVRELEQTRKCDQIATDLSILRENYRTYFNEQMNDSNAHSRMIESSGTKNEEFEYTATQTVFHYGVWTEKNLIGALSLWKKAYYYTVYKAENTFATIGAVTSLYAGSRGLRKMLDNYAKYAK